MYSDGPRWPAGGGERKFCQLDMLRGVTAVAAILDAECEIGEAMGVGIGVRGVRPGRGGMVVGMADFAAANQPFARSARGICCAVVRRAREGRRGRRRDGCMVAVVWIDDGGDGG